MLVIADASVKNIAISIFHIYRGQEIITKSVHYAMNITFIDVCCNKRSVLTLTMIW